MFFAFVFSFESCEAHSVSVPGARRSEVFIPVEVSAGAPRDLTAEDRARQSAERRAYYGLVLYGTPCPCVYSLHAGLVARAHRVLQKLPTAS